MEEITILTTSSESNENIAQEFYNTLTHDCPFIAEDNEKENVNKLKRKKHLSNSLSSIHGNVDEKRKKFEANARMEKSLITKPPLPPPRNVQKDGGRTNPPPRLKRKLEENTLIIGRLNAQSDQLRVEITNLKAALNNEKAAVRTLRAQNEGEVRKLRGEVKKLQSYLESKKRKKPAPQPPTTALKKESSFSDKLNQEVLLLKETKKSLEEKLSTNCSADRRKLYDIRELRDSYEIRLTHLSKSAKNEISRLLEEIKTKERNIGQLKSKINLMELNNNNKPATKTMQKVYLDKKDKDSKMSQNPKEINKLKNVDHQSVITKKSIILHTTTCGEKEFHSMPHERNERIIEAQNDIFNKDHQNSSDTDSALSSAPPSISPQPQLNGMESADIWQTIKTYSSDLEKLQKDYSFLLRENENLREELSSAKKQIEEFEKTVIEANNNAKLQELVNTIHFLEKKEYSLSQENHELQEQNELLEFRILELEGSHDKWSNNSSALDNKEDMWCDTGKFSEDALLFTPRSDSGITSPHSHNIDLLDHIPNEELRRRLSLIYKKPNLEEEEKQCLQQVLNLIQNLDSMSNESISSDEPISLEIVKSRTTELDSSNQSLPTHQKASKSCISNNNHRIVATISPYTTTSFTSQCSSPSDTPKRLRNWQTTSLSESGVFEGDSFENFSQSTQTEAEDLLEIFSTSHASRDLCAEIQKLTKFREEIEESSSVPSSSVIDLQKRLHYYKDRVEILEGKLIIYESSGDLQTKRLADRLQREVQLEYSVKELSDRVDILKLENSILEEEKCEFEEAENDTRLKLQRLEVDLEILSQRNVELEVSREAFQQKLNETKQLNLEIQQEFQKSQDRVELLEHESKELLETLNLLKNRRHSSEIKMDTCESDNKNEEDFCHQDRSPMENETKIMKLQSEIHNLREREQKLICEIKKIQLHYREVMENADHHWKQLETNLTSQLAEACSNEACLKTKILQLEKRLFCDSSAAQEKIACLEESEDELKKCLNKLTRDNRRLNEDYCALNEELIQCREEFKKTNQSDSKCLDQEKCRNKELSDEVEYLKKSLAESESAGKQELQCLKHELCRVKKELLQIEVTNAELREEVCTLENTISDLQKICKNDNEKIRCLGDELRDRDDLCDQMERKLNRCTCGSKSKSPKNCNKANQSPCSREEISLAQELGEDKCPSKKLKREEVKDLKQASHLLGQALTQMEKDLEAKHFNRQFFEEDLDNLDNLDHKYVPCHCCRDKMSDSSNEQLFERQIGGANPCHRKRIHANVNDFNDTVWMDAIEKVNECSRNIGESLNVCEDEATQTPKDPCSKKSSKSIYADCHSRPFQDCVEEPTPVTRKCSKTKARLPCEHKKLKDVFNAIEDLYGIANDHRSQHQCPNCGGFKQSMADVCDPCENDEKDSRQKDDCKANPSQWVPVDDENCIDQIDDLELKELVEACSSQRDSICSLDDITDITKRLESMCASIRCNRYSRKETNSNQCTSRKSRSFQSSESSVPQRRRNCSRCQQQSCSEFDEREEPCRPLTKQQPCNKKEQLSNLRRDPSCNPTTKELPCNQSFREPKRDQKVPCCNPTFKKQRTDPCDLEESNQSNSQEQKRDQKLNPDPCDLQESNQSNSRGPKGDQKLNATPKEDLQESNHSNSQELKGDQKVATSKEELLETPVDLLNPNQSNSQETKENPTSKEQLPDAENLQKATRSSSNEGSRKEDPSKEKENLRCCKKYSCSDICNEPSYSKLQDCEKSDKDEPCNNDEAPLVPPDLLCNLTRICDILKKYEKNMKANSCPTKSESQNNSSCKSNESANLSRSSIINDYRSGPESEGFTTPKTRISVSILEETEEGNTGRKSRDEPVENMLLPVTGQTTERTTSFHSKDCVTADCEGQTGSSHPGSNGSQVTPVTPCGQHCCIPCIPMFPMPMCADAKCWPFMCCPKEVRNCPNDEGHKCNHGNSNSNGVSCSKDNGVQQFVKSLLCDLNDMKKTLSSCMEGDSGPRCPTCRPPPSPVCCQGYPVSIHCVKPLGNKSLMVYWIVHDFRDISGYEIRMDGCMKNRYFTSGHDCAVVYGVDLCVPHEIELVAIPELRSPEIPTDEDLSKSIVPVATQTGRRKSHFQTNGSVWTPSVYIYDPMKQ